MCEIDKTNQPFDTTLIMSLIEQYLINCESDNSLVEVLLSVCTQCAKIELELMKSGMNEAGELLANEIQDLKQAVTTNHPEKLIICKLISLITALNSISQNALPISLTENILETVESLKHPVIESPTQDELYRKENSAIQRRIAYLEEWGEQHNKAKELFNEDPNESNAELARKLCEYYRQLNIERGIKAPIKCPSQRIAEKWFSKLKKGEVL